ncbi:uncharacterized protein LOC111829420 [Capsella rubella]|uniref:uncharacterized protein LOC111829420 n=1 Tax=Capsella rubella TaxID=81985 RepID=UPI000CD539D8|nr:uncharacterized protein LOC111829420 [Capsella rubella]
MAIPMFEDIKKSLTSDGLELTVVSNLQTIVFFGRTKKEDMDEYPIMTIEEMLKATEVGPCRTLCTVKENDTDYSCFAEEIVGTAATDIIPKGSFDLFEDPTDLLDPIKALVGKSFVFLLCIEPKHIHGKCDIFRVAQVSDGKISSVPEISLSDTYVDQSSFYSADQGSLMISNGVETSEVGISTSSTPSSKRDSSNLKEGDVQSSTSKKQCSKMGEVDDVKVATKEEKEKHKLD